MRKRSRLLPLALGVLVILSVLVWIQKDWLVAKIYMWTLESQGRVKNLQIERVIRALEIEPGQRLADVGAGTGLFSRPLARAAGQGGVVYAVDINPELLSHIEETAKREGIRNIRTVLAMEDDPQIPEPVDLIFLCDTLHHIDNRAGYMKTLRRYLRADGRIAIVDFARNSPHIIPSMKYSLTELEDWMEAAGYEPVGRHEFLDSNFFVVYKCPECPAS